MSRTCALPTLPRGGRVTWAALREGERLRVALPRGSQGVEVVCQGSNEGREGARRMRARAARQEAPASRQILQCFPQFHSQNRSDPLSRHLVNALKCEQVLPRMLNSCPEC